MNWQKTALSLVVLLVLLTQSCVKHRDLVNFDEGKLEQHTPEQILNAIEIKIQPEDLLRITVHALDPLAAEPFNIESANGNNQRMQNAQSLELFSGYFVDEYGFIDFPVLGRIEVAGQTLEETKLEILELLKEYLKNPVVNIRYLNFKVTVLGEVNQPGTLKLTNKRVTLLEAIGMAGDLTSYANREEILVIREEAGVRSYQRINLKSNEIFASPYFYLKQNDVIYIEPTKARVATVADPVQRFISYTSATLSLVSLILALTSR